MLTFVSYRQYVLRIALCIRNTYSISFFRIDPALVSTSVNIKWACWTQYKSGLYPKGPSFDSQAYKAYSHVFCFVVAFLIFGAKNIICH